MDCCYCLKREATKTVTDNDGDELTFCDVCWNELKATSNLVARSIAK